MDTASRLYETLFQGGGNGTLLIRLKLKDHINYFSHENSYHL